MHTWIFSLRCCTTLRRKYSLDSFFLNICFVNLTLRRLTGINRTQLSSPLSLDSYCSSQKMFHMVKLFSLVISSQCFLQNRSQGVESINGCFCLSCRYFYFSTFVSCSSRMGSKARDHRCDSCCFTVVTNIGKTSEPVVFYQLQLRAFQQMQLASQLVLYPCLLLP